MNLQDEERRAPRMEKAAHFPLEFCVIAAVGAFMYGRALTDCSSSDTAASSASASSSASTASSTIAGGTQ